jgi:hypothetical protein
MVPIGRGFALPVKAPVISGDNTIAPLPLFSLAHLGAHDRRIA